MRSEETLVGKFAKLSAWTRIRQRRYTVTTRYGSQHHDTGRERERERERERKREREREREREKQDASLSSTALLQMHRTDASA